MKELLEKSILGVTRWVEEHGYQAYDPGDGAMSFLQHLTFGNHGMRRSLTAAVLRTPFHIRPLIGIAPHKSTKGIGYMAWGYVKMFALTGDASYRRRAEFCLDWLMENRSHAEPTFCWGNHFSFSTRAGTIPAHTPTIVWSSLIGLAFLEAYEVLGNSSYLDVAASTAEWIKTLPREKTDSGTCLSYIPFRQSSIHNSNMLGAALLARVSAHTNDREARRIARDAMTYSCARQQADGAWFYGEHPRFQWVDNFHTGYNLDCLRRYIDSTGDTEFEPHLRRGLEYFMSHFIEESGRPKYYHNRVHPIDIQCAAQSIDTMAFFSDVAPGALECGLKVARWTIERMQAPDGHFYYRDLGWKRVKTPMLHWGQGTMFKALAHLTAKLTLGTWASDETIQSVGQRDSLGDPRSVQSGV